MKIKSVICWILSFCMVSSISALTFAKETNSKELEKIIVAVKKLITIPDSYTEFTYSSTSSTEYEEEYEEVYNNPNVWNLEWSEPMNEDTNGRISISIDENNNLLSYNKYTNGKTQQTRLAQFTRNQAQDVAEEFIAKVLPKYASQMVNIDSNTTDFYNSYNFEYKQFINNVPVSFTNVNISVNKYNNEVESFRASGFQNEFEYPSVDGIIKYSDAKKSYIEKLGIDLKYYSNYNYKNKQLDIFPAYSINNSTFKAIDGKTGELIDIFKPNFTFYVENALSKSSSQEALADSVYNLSGASDMEQLTKEEIDAVNSISNIISKEEAGNIIKENIDITIPDIKITNASLSKNYIDKDEYIWSISFGDIYGQVNAKSRELLSFYYYDKDNKNLDTKISEDEAKTIAENFLKKVSYDKFSQTQYKKVDTPSVKIIKPNNDNTYHFDFIRQVNGIDFVNNSLTLTVDGNGKVINYNSNWYKKAIFPDINDIMTQEEIFDTVNKSEKFGLTYKISDKNKVVLVYDFTDLNTNYLFDPIEGSKIDYTGEKYVSNTIPEYIDIEGHWCEKTVNALLQNGYYIQGETFAPDHNITQINFLKYLYSPSQTYYKDDEFYKMLIEDGIIKKEEQSPDSYVSRQDALKFIVKYLGYDEIANHSEIFINPFKDTIQKKYLGYASICYGLGIITADEQGNFNGTNNITNAEAATLIYGLLNVK